MVEIREAVPDDAEAISELNNSQMGYVFSTRDTYEKLCDILRCEKDKVFVAIIEGNVVGYIHANNYDLLYHPHMKNIMGITVDEKFKRQGIGRMLIEAVEVWAKKTGAAGIRLLSGATRTDAHSFYKSCGFSGDKEQVNLKKIFN